MALEQKKDKGKSTLVGLAVLRSGGKCCHEQRVWGISQGNRNGARQPEHVCETTFKLLLCPGEGL